MGRLLRRTQSSVVNKIHKGKNQDWRKRIDSFDVKASAGPPPLRNITAAELDWRENEPIRALIMQRNEGPPENVRGEKDYRKMQYVYLRTKELR